MSASNRVLVLGAAGLLGRHVARAVDGLGVFELHRQTSERFTTPGSVHDALSRFNCQTVINCIGYRGEDPLQHFLVNACLPRAIADWCAESGALCVHISTNAVFPASEDTAWEPADRPEPHTPYEISKLFGEDPRTWVIRASFIGLAGNRAGILRDLVEGRPYWDRTWNGVTATSLARRIGDIVRDHSATSVSAIEHVHSPAVTRMSTVARLVGSRSSCMGSRDDARILAGGRPMPDLETQLAEEMQTINAPHE